MAEKEWDGTISISHLKKLKRRIEHNSKVRVNLVGSKYYDKHVDANVVVLLKRNEDLDDDQWDGYDIHMKRITVTTACGAVLGHLQAAHADMVYEALTAGLQALAYTLQSSRERPFARICAYFMDDMEDVEDVEDIEDVEDMED